MIGQARTPGARGWSCHHQKPHGLRVGEGIPQSERVLLSRGRAVGCGYGGSQAKNPRKEQEGGEEVRVSLGLRQSL